MKTWLLILLFLFITANVISQNSITAQVVDLDSEVPLQYCNIVFLGNNKGTITNNAGLFAFNTLYYDSLKISYVGYKTKIIAVKSISNNDIIKLQKTKFSLAEFSVHANNDYLFKVISKLRKSLKDNKMPYVSKVYYGVESQTNNIPIEFLECFYNADITGEYIDKLTYKNGRVGLAKVDGNYFETFNTAKAISRISITNNNLLYPGIPTQFSIRKNKKKFKLTAYSNADNITKIDFTPIDSTVDFSGTFWVNTSSNLLLKIDLWANNTSKHPFLPLHQTDKISNLNIHISKFFYNKGNETLLDHVYFDYSFIYKTERGQRVFERNITTKGIIRVYDYDKPFIIPYFQYPDNIRYGDYYRMSFIPYNSLFWDNNESIALTEQQQKKLGFFANHGKLINYRDGNFGNDFIQKKIDNDTTDDTHFYFYFPFWDAKKRITIRKDLPQNYAINIEQQGAKIKSDLYNIEAQFLLDITSIGDSLNFRSYTVFDSYRTFYELPIDSITYAFINIYLDLYEIQRRKMQEELEERNWSLSEADSIYHQNIISIEKTTKKYIKEVRIGENIAKLEDWNQYVLDNLGIDNLLLIHFYILLDDKTDSNNK